MQLHQASLQEINVQISQIIDKAQQLEANFVGEISAVHPDYTKSARNLIHYLAFRSFEIDLLQDRLREIGLPSLTNIEGHVMESLLSIKTIISYLIGDPKVEYISGIIKSKKSRKIFKQEYQAAIWEQV